MNLRQYTDQATTVTFALAALVGISVYLQGFHPKDLLIIQTLQLICFIPVFYKSYYSDIKIPHSMLLYSLLAFWAWGAVSLSFALNKVVGIYAFCVLSCMPLSAFLYLCVPKKEIFWKRFVVLLALIAFAIACHSLYQYGFVRGGSKGSFFVNRNTMAAFLNVVFFPSLAFVLIYFQGSRCKSILIKIIVWSVLFVISYATLRSTGRGATFSLLFGVIAMLFMLRRYVDRTVVLSILLAFALQYAVIDMKSKHHVITKTVTRLHTNVLKTPRGMIWRSSWELLKDSPWYGIGIGNYLVKYPKYTTPKDHSSRYYAHNDYLQMWIELGVPGLALLFMLMASVFFSFVRFVKSVPEREDFIEVCGLFFGLLAVAAHSVITYNFYAMAVLIPFGFMLGRFFHKTLPVGVRYFSFTPSNSFSKKGYYTIGALLFFIALTYNNTMQLAGYYYKEGWRYYSKNDLVKSDEALKIAGHLFNSSFIEDARGILYFSALETAPDQDDQAKQLLFNTAKSHFLKAIAMNPGGSKFYYNLASMEAEHPEFAGPRYIDEAKDLYLAGIDADPFYFLNRLGYAKLMLKQGERELARKILSDGIPYPFQEDARIAEYFELLAQFYEDDGDVDIALALREQGKTLGEKFKDKRA